MSEQDIFIQLGRMLEAHGDSDNKDSNMWLFERAGLTGGVAYDASLTAFDVVLRNLAERLRKGDDIGVPIDFPVCADADSR